MGFSLRKAARTICGAHDDGPVEPLLADPGPHETGTGCLYLKRLDAVDSGVLEQRLRNAWAKRT